jgi:hypothetical protein
MIQSPSDPSPWVYSMKSVFTYRIKSEGRSVWRIYLELEDYEEAKKHCHDDQTIRTEVLNAQAQNLLSTACKNPTANSFREAARIFAKSDVLISEVALKLLPRHDASIEENRFRNESIIFFLKHRLPRVERYTEKALLIGWLLELYLTSRAEMADLYGKRSEQIKTHRQNFLQFLSDPIIR